MCVLFSLFFLHLFVLFFFLYLFWVEDHTSFILLSLFLSAYNIVLRACLFSCNIFFNIIYIYVMYGLLF